MRAYDPKSIKYRDKLAEKRRRVLILKTLFFFGLVIAVIGLILYLLFFSKLLDIKDITLNGLDKVDSQEFNGKLNEQLNSKWLGHIEKQKNIIFFNSSSLRAEVLASFPEIKDISVSKTLPHALSIDVIERKTVGIWCFMDSGSIQRTTSCKYFDEEGNMWGEAASSSGFLVMSVEDMRSDATLDKDLLDNFRIISEQLKNMDILVSKFSIPSDFFGDFRALTSKGYELFFSTDSTVTEQIETLKIFLAEKKNNADFKPQYIDLRINGRIYYK